MAHNNKTSDEESRIQYLGPHRLILTGIFETFPDWLEKDNLDTIETHGEINTYGATCDNQVYSWD